MANKRKLTVDKTYLSLDQAESRGFIHRDYIAHCLRWTHVLKTLGECKRYAQSRILDVGCGRELPFAKTLYSSRYIPVEYVGVDVGPIEDEAALAVAGEGKKFPCRLYENTDLMEDGFLDGEKFEVITCFEVLEHVEPQHMCQMLLKMRRLLTDGGIAFLSTPCWNERDCADNHVDEIKYQTLGAVLEDLGFTIVSTNGTFASQRDYKHLLTRPQYELFTQLSDYYDSNFLSCVFAPLFPAQSRNVLWKVTPGFTPSERRWFMPLLTGVPPYGSSDRWADAVNWYPNIVNTAEITK